MEMKHLRVQVTTNVKEKKTKYFLPADVSWTSTVVCSSHSGNNNCHPSTVEQNRKAFVVTAKHSSTVQLKICERLYYQLLKLSCQSIELEKLTLTDR